MIMATWSVTPVQKGTSLLTGPCGHILYKSRTTVLYYEQL